MDVVLQSVSQMLDSFLYQLSPTDNKCLGRRPAYLLTLVANAVPSSQANLSSSGGGGGRVQQPMQVLGAWRTRLLAQWDQAGGLMGVIEREGLDGPSTAGSGPSIVARLGNLLTAFHDARRLLWPAERPGERPGRPLADFLMVRWPKAAIFKC